MTAVHRPLCPSCVLAAFAAALLIAGCGGSDTESVSEEPFAPRASLRAVGGTVRTDKPRLVIRVEARPGDENIRSVAVNLPPVVLVDTTAVGKICSQRELKSDECAGSHRLGSARVLSPAYDGALSGPVYLVSGSGGPLPGLAYLLSGPADVLLRGRVVSKGGRIQAGVDDVPDTPLNTFELTLDGGRSGYLVLSRNICKARALADGTFTSQEGQTYRQKIPLEADC
jgi:hypothetical protein